LPRKLRQLRAELRALGFALIRTNGSHETWRHPSGIKATVAGADEADAKRYQERDLAEARAAVARAGGGGSTIRKD
jgi:predicted RNA binding protein YcfA (HicA-like mRNA interferase family)